MANKKLTITQFNKSIDDLITQLPDKLLDVMERVILVSKKDITTRIVNTGKDARGNPLIPYKPSYKQFKEDVGRYRGHVDYQLGNYSINKRISAVASRAKARNKKAKHFGERTGENTKLSKQKKAQRKRAIEQEAQAKKESRRANAIAKGSRLWESIQLTYKKNDAGKLSVLIAPTDALNLKKAQGLISGNGKGSWKGRGDFFELSVSENLRAIEGFNNGYEQIVNEIIPTK